MGYKLKARFPADQRKKLPKLNGFHESHKDTWSPPMPKQDREVTLAKRAARKAK